MIAVAMKRMMPMNANQMRPLIAKPSTATTAHIANRMMMKVNMLLTVLASIRKRNRHLAQIAAGGSCALRVLSTDDEC